MNTPTVNVVVAASFISPARIVCRIDLLVFLMLEPAAISMPRKRRAGGMRYYNVPNWPMRHQMRQLCLLVTRSVLLANMGPVLPVTYQFSELSPLALLKNLVALGCDLALPITPEEGQPLQFHRWEIDGLLNDGPYGTKQPPACNDKCNPDVILAPMLAFDGDGWRLGYGGGFYDRTVSSLREFGQRVTLIGIAYEGQKVDKIPVGPFDMPLDAVLSPAGLFEP